MSPRGTRLAHELRHQVAQPRAEHRAATVNAHDRDALASGLLDDLVGDAHQRASHILAVETRFSVTSLPLPGLSGPG